MKFIILNQLAAQLPPMDPLAMISHLTEGLSSDCAKELQTLVDKLKNMMPNQQPQGALARAVQMPAPPPPAPTGAQPSGTPPVAPDADLDQCYTGGTYYQQPYYRPYQPAPYPYPYPYPYPAPTPVTNPTTTNTAAQLLVS